MALPWRSHLLRPPAELCDGEKEMRLDANGQTKTLSAAAAQASMMVAHSPKILKAIRLHSGPGRYPPWVLGSFLRGPQQVCRANLSGGAGPLSGSELSHHACDRPGDQSAGTPERDADTGSGGPMQARQLAWALLAIAGHAHADSGTVRRGLLARTKLPYLAQLADPSRALQQQPPGAPPYGPQAPQRRQPQPHHAPAACPGGSVRATVRGPVLLSPTAPHSLTAQGCRQRGRRGAGRLPSARGVDAWPD